MYRPSTYPEFILQITQLFIQIVSAGEEPIRLRLISLVKLFSLLLESGHFDVVLLLDPYKPHDMTR